MSARWTCADPAPSHAPSATRRSAPRAGTRRVRALRGSTRSLSSDARSRKRRSSRSLPGTARERQQFLDCGSLHDGLAADAGLPGAPAGACPRGRRASPPRQRPSRPAAASGSAVRRTRSSRVRAGRIERREELARVPPQVFDAIEHRVSLRGWAAPVPPSARCRSPGPPRPTCSRRCRSTASRCLRAGVLRRAPHAGNSGITSP